MAKRIPNSAIPRPSAPLTRNRRNYGKTPPSNISLSEQATPQARPEKPPHRPANQPLKSPESIQTHLPIPASSPSVTVESILAGKLSEETKRAYRSDLKYFLKFLGYHTPIKNPDEFITILSGVTRDTAAAYRDYMLNDKGLSAATVKRYLATISTVYEALREESIISRNPFSWVKRPKVPNIGKTAAFTEEQAGLILEQPNLSTPMGRRDRIILLLLFFCGLRRSEVIKICKEDFFETQGHLMLWVFGKGRSDKSESVMVPDLIQNEIRAYLSEKEEGPIFTALSRNIHFNNTGKPISANRIYLMFKGYCEQAGIDPNGYSPHSSRATFITLCLKGGADVRSVMYSARHSNPSTTLLYDRARLDIENHASKYLHIKMDKTPAE